MSFVKSLLEKIFGDPSERELEKLQDVVEQINRYEPDLEKMSDANLRAKTAEFKRHLSAGKTLDDILPEAFAVVREGSRRVLGMRHFDVQLLGGAALHMGRIAEMRTGEGKTLVATLAAYLNALEGKGVHVITVNDYLARRDSEWMGKLYQFLGLSVGLIVHGKESNERKQAYQADITYGTNNEFGFDYLRDNMVMSPDQMVQRPLHFAIVDEVDSILIDEARTPLIISGPGEQSTEHYYKLSKIVTKLRRDQDYTIDETSNTISPTDQGITKAEKALGVGNLYDGENMVYSHHFTQALKAHFLMERDKDYVVKDGEVVIVDEFTGRLMFGRRYSDGLHQAIEAKENVKIERESKTLATITFQNYFRMYGKLSGMTGTAKTEESEFVSIYNLPVITIPTNRPVSRIDHPDIIFKTRRAKTKAIVRDIVERFRTGQPVLAGTTSIVQSEEFSGALKKAGIPHQVLNAKFHDVEAEIIRNAGQRGTVTIATNMAGRGTDIVLGEGVPELGGLYVLGTERHESRRIDNQLRGRCARQGDAGESRFYISLEDELMRIFGSDSIAMVMEKLGIDEDDPIEHAMITRSIEQAQKKVEGRNFDIRKHILEYDNVMNEQRKVIYSQREKILKEDNLKEQIEHMVGNLIDDMMVMYVSEKKDPEDWDIDGLVPYGEQFFLPAGRLNAEELKNFSREEIDEKLREVASSFYGEREVELSSLMMRELERIIMLKVQDSKWVDHLDAMEMLRQGINLRAYGQKNPLQEYKLESYEMFQELMQSMQEEIIKYIYRVQIAQEPESQLKNAKENIAPSGEGTADPEEEIGRNDLCPCGSGKKYKKCCGRE
jgi:preprotein translocase, SecA subunit